MIFSLRTKRLIEDNGLVSQTKIKIVVQLGYDIAMLTLVELCLKTRDVDGKRIIRMMQKHLEGQNFFYLQVLPFGAI